jgi:uncharacterized Zn-finger protein
MAQDPGAGGNRQATAPTKHVEITARELPLYCPMDSMSLWNSHPRVYLPIEDTGEERCPYCGTLYVLRRDGDAA